MQLSGHRLSDHAMSTATTVGDLYAAFKTKEKSKKLVDTDQLQHIKTNLPNVAVYPRKRTVAAKEAEVGRWKLIQAEMFSRGLPTHSRPQREAVQ